MTDCIRTVPGEHSLKIEASLEAVTFTQQRPGHVRDERAEYDHSQAIDNRDDDEINCASVFESWSERATR